MESRPHASIGEVLAELHAEFPDVTISKIRFLESQGLIGPERTPSGYRKFYEEDVARLRWILIQQQDNFLPLKVIKERLADMDRRGVAPGSEPSEPAEKPTKASGAAKKRGASSERGSRRKRASVDTLELPLDDGPANDLESATSGTSLNRKELARAAKTTEDLIAELEAYGLLAPAGQVGDQVFFDEEALIVVASAAGFAKRGIEPRHLRMYRSFAEREAGLFQQVVLPLLKARNPEARRGAQDEIIELAKLGRALRAVYLRTAVADLLDE